MIRFGYQSGIERRVTCIKSIDGQSVVIEVKAVAVSLSIHLSLKEAETFRDHLIRVLRSSQGETR